MIKDNDRLIIIDGMAHSGTTVLTYILKQHPDIYCEYSGPNVKLLEAEWINRQNPHPIRKSLAKHPYKRVLLKRPWASYRNFDFLVNRMPDARYIYCYKDFNDIIKSWEKPTSLVEPLLRTGSLQEKEVMYRKFWDSAMRLKEKVTFFKEFYYLDLLKNPSVSINSLVKWLNMSPHPFDLSKVSKDVNIKRLT